MHDDVFVLDFQVVNRAFQALWITCDPIIYKLACDSFDHIPSPHASSRPLSFLRYSKSQLLVLPDFGITVISTIMEKLKNLM